MAVPLSAHQVRLLRQRAQRLDAPQPDAAAGAAQVARVVHALGGVQAQYEVAAALTIRARTAGLVAADVERERVDARSVVRTWCQRSTLHLLAAEDMCWLLPLVGPVFPRASRRRLALGLDAETAARGVRALRAALAEQGPLTRAELVEHLKRRGLRLEGQAAPHLLAYAALQGVVCCGPDRRGTPTYALLDDWLPGWAHRGPPLPREAALAELARRYLAAYGPAAPEDLAAWSGLPFGEARAAWRQIAGELLEVDAAGQPAWLPTHRGPWLDEVDPLTGQEERPPAPAVVRLVAGYDPYLLGYRHRDLAVAPEHARHVHPGGGLLHPTLLVDGRALGTWRTQQRRARLEVVVQPFGALAAGVRRRLEAEATDVDRFLGMPAALCAAAPQRSGAAG